MKTLMNAALLALMLTACATQVPEHGGTPETVATSKAIEPAVAKQVAERFHAKLPKTQVANIRHSVIPGLYEVVAGRNVFYVDEQVNYLVIGAVYDIAKQKDLTSARQDEVNRVEFKDLPEQAAIVIKQGDGRHKLAVFSDPDCPFCRKIEPELAKLENTTIYVYLMPLPMHTDAARKSAAVWCHADRASAWRDMMINGKVPDGDAKCETPMGDVAKLAKTYGIKATPTLINADGKIHPGFMPSDRLSKWITGGQS